MSLFRLHLCTRLHYNIIQIHKPSQKTENKSMRIYYLSHICAIMKTHLQLKSPCRLPNISKRLIHWLYHVVCKKAIIRLCYLKNSLYPYKTLTCLYIKVLRDDQNNEQLIITLQVVLILEPFVQRPFRVTTGPCTCNHCNILADTQLQHHTLT